MKWLEEFNLMKKYNLPASVGLVECVQLVQHDRVGKDKLDDVLSQQTRDLDRNMLIHHRFTNCYAKKPNLKIDLILIRTLIWTLSLTINKKLYLTNEKKGELMRRIYFASPSLPLRLIPLPLQSLLLLLLLLQHSPSFKWYNSFNLP